MKEGAFTKLGERAWYLFGELIRMAGPAEWYLTEAAWEIDATATAEPGFSVYAKGLLDLPQCGSVWAVFTASWWRYVFFWYFCVNVPTCLFLGRFTAGRLTNKRWSRRMVQALSLIHI